MLNLSQLRFTRYLSVLVIALQLAPVCAQAGGHHEKYYQNLWCARFGGVAEVVLSDRSRVDCLTSTHAIEFDFAQKWAESIGQALYYSKMTGRKPGIVLIMSNNKDKRYLNRLNRAISETSPAVDVWIVSTDE